MWWHRLHLWLIGMALMLTSCGAPAPIPVAQLPAYEGRTVTVAGAIVIHADDAWLVAYVVAMPDVPLQLAPERYAIDLSWIQQQFMAWRDDGDVRYVPAIVTGEVRDGRLQNISHIDTSIREQTVVTNDANRIVRFVGHAHTHPDGTYLHDQYQPDQSVGFWPAWVDARAPIRLAEGAQLLIEGVRVDTRLIAVVVAPVIEK